MKKTVNIGIAILFFISMALYSFNMVEVADDWNVPDNYKNMKNPTEASKQNHFGQNTARAATAGKVSATGLKLLNSKRTQGIFHPMNSRPIQMVNYST
jgi:hypothetical protein